MLHPQFLNCILYFLLLEFCEQQIYDDGNSDIICDVMMTLHDITVHRKMTAWLIPQPTQCSGLPYLPGSLCRDFGRCFYCLCVLFFGYRAVSVTPQRTNYSSNLGSNGTQFYEVI